MRHTSQISRGSSGVPLRVLWFRLQSRIAGFYAHRVTQPCENWREKEESPNKRQGYHYYYNAETYFNVGEGLGWAMADLLAKRK